MRQCLINRKGWYMAIDVAEILQTQGVTFIDHIKTIPYSHYKFMYYRKRRWYECSSVHHKAKLFVSAEWLTKKLQTNIIKFTKTTRSIKILQHDPKVNLDNTQMYFHLPDRIKSNLLTFGYIRSFKSHSKVCPSELFPLIESYCVAQTYKELCALHASAQKAKQTYIVLKLERTLLIEICCTKSLHKLTCDDEDYLKALTLFKGIINNWISKQNLILNHDTFIMALEGIIMQNEHVLLQYIIQKVPDYVKDVFEWRFFDLAVIYASFECFVLLVELSNESPRLDWDGHRNPSFLKAAIKHQYQNKEFIESLFDVLETLEIGFVCHDIYHEAIEMDLANVVERIVSNRWYLVSDEDFLVAKEKNGKCWEYLERRARASSFNREYLNNDYEPWSSWDDSSVEEWSQETLN